jgi:hypothetical protein
VVLLPIEEGQPTPSYQAGEGFKQIKGLELNHPEQGQSLERDFAATLKWDKKYLTAIVVDGQHRVMALRELMERTGSSAGDSLPVSFIIFEPTESLDVIEATRQLFIDINNTPRRVSEQRLIFIDDRHVLRRMTASIVGAQAPGSSSQDVYQAIHDGDKFESEHFEDLLNRFLLGEDATDDEESDKRFRSHDQLLPWQVTHLMTLHEAIVKDCLLSFEREYSAGPDLRRLCQIIDRNSTSVVLDMTVETGFSEEARAKILDSLRDDAGANDSEVKLFRRITGAKQYEVDQLSAQLDEGLTPEDEDMKEFERDVRAAFLREMRGEHAFYLPPEEVSQLLRGRLSRVAKLVVFVFKELAFVKRVERLLDKGTSDVSAQLLHKLVLTEKSSQLEGSSLSGLEIAKKAAARVVESAVASEKDAVRQKLALFLEKEQKIASNNILRTVVGQQALFAYIVEVDREDRDDLSISDSGIQEEIDFINGLASARFFDKDNKLAFDTLGNEVSFHGLEGVLVKSTVGQASIQMKPGWPNAKKAVTLLRCIKMGVSDRKDAQQTVTLNPFNALIKAIGSAVLLHLEYPDGAAMSSESVISKVADQFSDQMSLWITTKESERIANGYNENDETRQLNVIRKVLGGHALSQIVKSFSD